MLPPPLSPAACMKTTMHIMHDIVSRLYLCETCIIRWPNVRPAGKLRSVDITCAEWFGIEDIGADCVRFIFAVECCSPNKPEFGKDTFARDVEQHGPDVGKDPSVMT